MADIQDSPRRPVRSIDVDTQGLSAVAGGIDDLYSGALDVIVARNIFSHKALADVGERLDTDTTDPGWARPNEKMPVEDLQVLGTDSPATPTFRNPRGVDLDAYLTSAAAHISEAQAVFGSEFDAASEIARVLSLFVGGRPAEVPHGADGRTYVPFTVRRLVHGKQIGIHHDYHYPLNVYRELAPQVDTTTLISYVATLREPEAGGELFVYGATSDMKDVPKLSNGFSYDLPAIEARYDHARFVTHPGDLFLLASGRCLHRVGMVAGPRARVTMGGFLALGKAHDRVFFWS